MGILVKELMTNNFDVLPETITPENASSQLKDNNYGVVIDSNDNPVALILGEDLSLAINKKAPSLLHPSASLPPLIIVDSEAEMNELDSVMTLFNAGARGAVITEDKRVIGVLPVDTVIEYLVSNDYKLPIRIMVLSASGGDSMLAGSYKTPLGKIRCAKCGFINEISFLDEYNLPICKNPEKPSHKLSLS